MKKTLGAVALAAMMAPGIASARDSTGCGFGSMVFDGQEGVAPQVLAVTTNGFFGNQTFGISSGTLGCDQDGPIDSMADVSDFANDNLDQLAADIAAGEGETLATVGDLIGVSAADRDRFYSVTQQNFTRIFPSTETTSEEVVATLRDVMAEDTTLSAYVS